MNFTDILAFFHISSLLSISLCNLQIVKARLVVIIIHFCFVQITHINFQIYEIHVNRDDLSNFTNQCIA